MTLASKELPSDLSKLLGEWALAAGRLLQSEQTGYVHAYYGESQQVAHTIPLVENVLFALALLRSRLVEQVQEAKGILKGLLAFQNLNKENYYGNFPVYLHEYPVCKDPSIGLQLLAPFYWILKHFGHVLGSDLRGQLEQSARLALEYSISSHKIKPFPYSLAVRLAAAQLAYGCLWAKLEWQQEGEAQLEEFAKKQLNGWYSTAHLGDILVGLQMVYPSLKNNLWSQLWHHLEYTWHHQTGCYVGPCVREWQEGEEPQTNLYDLYGGYFAGQFSRRATLIRPYHLHGVLIQSSPDRFDAQLSSFTAEGQFKQQNWQIVASPKWAYTLLEKKELSHPSVDKTYTPFRLIWGDIHRMHSLVCQGGGYEKVQYQLFPDHSIELTYDLIDYLTEEERAPQREVEFFVDFHPDILFTLNGLTATTFELDQPITLSFGKSQMTIVFKLLEGEGNFLGHVMRGNRPSQVNHKGEKRFQAYDWTFFLRTIRRQSPCRLKVILSFQPLLD